MEREDFIRCCYQETVMATDIVTVQLTREDDKEKWGFQISGGKDQNCPLVISEVKKSVYIYILALCTKFNVNVKVL